jgi:hypothetical protein
MNLTKPLNFETHVFNYLTYNFKQWNYNDPVYLSITKNNNVYSINFYADTTNKNASYRQYENIESAIKTLLDCAYIFTKLNKQINWRIGSIDDKPGLDIYL